MRFTDRNVLYALQLFGQFFESPGNWGLMLSFAEETETGAKNRDFLDDFCNDFPDDFLDKTARATILTDEFCSDYEALFHGTDADIYVPLWASACKTGDRILLDETTLRFILRCRDWGFDPPRIDGNPPDFIGGQLAFLLYLQCCALYEESHGGNAEKYLKAANDFRNDFFIDTVSALTSAVRCYSQNRTISAFIELFAAFAGDFTPPFGLRRDMDAESFLPAAALTALRQGQATPIATEAEQSVLSSGVNDCGGRCVLKIRTRAGCILEISTDESTRDPQLRACLRGRAYRRTYYDASRLRYPMKRVGKRGEGKFKRISWDEAADIIAAQWTRIRDNYGPASRLILNSTGNEAVLRGDAFVARLLNLDGGYLGQYGSYSAACVHEISPYIYGDLMGGNSVDDLLNTKFLILWGHNPIETIYGTERVRVLTRLKEKGVRIVVVDPRQSDSAVVLADEWIGIRPSTDGAMADAMAYVILTEGLIDRDFMNRYTTGFDAAHMPGGVDGSESCETYLLGKTDGVPKTPAWAENICGVSAETIASLARDYANAKPACLWAGLGVQRVGNGEQTVRSLALLCAMTGNVGISGGGSGADMGVGGQQFIAFPTLENKVDAEISFFLWSKAIADGPGLNPEEHGLRGVRSLNHGVKMVFCVAGNSLINQHSNINETRRILDDESKCEFILCSDVFMTASARYADLLLPAACVFEQDNFSHSWAGIGYYLMCNNKVVEPPFGCRFEWDWVKDVAGRLGYEEAFTGGKPELEQWRESLYNELSACEPELPGFANFCAAGGHSYREGRSYVAYSAQREDLENHPFATPSGRIELYSKRIAALDDPCERPPIPRYVPCAEGYEDEMRAVYPLQFISWKTKRRTHSIHENNPWLEEAEPQMLWMHPQDAESRGIQGGDIVNVFNARGKVRLPVFVTRRLVAGVVAMPAGAWYTPDEEGTDLRGCVNVLTSTHKPTPYAKGNPQQTNLVQVEKAQVEKARVEKA